MYYIAHQQVAGPPSASGYWAPQFLKAFCQTLLPALQISASDYAAAQPDPIASFAAPIAKHMNEDHAESTVAMLRHFGKLSAEAAQIVGLDSLGLDLLVTKDSQSFKGRLPFAR